MDIRKVLSYLSEELKDIPAKPDNIHYTDFEGLYYILQNGLKGQKGGYTVKSPKTKEDDMELSTVRNSHKLTPEEKMELSAGAIGGIKINLFTDRLLAAHRGTRKDQIAELPEQSMRYLKSMEKSFRKYHGFEIPKLYEKEKFFWKQGRKLDADMDVAEAWTEKHHPELSPLDKRDVNTYIVNYNRGWLAYLDELKNREREERLILKKNIPVDPKFMEIVIEKSPIDMGYSDKEFCRDPMHTQNYLHLLDKHEDVFVQNKAFRDLKNYLRKI